MQQMWNPCQALQKYRRVKTVAEDAVCVLDIVDEFYQKVKREIFIYVEVI